jgi:hypothetical protein
VAAKDRHIVGPVYKAVNELGNLEFGSIPLLEKEGWLRHQQKLRSHRSAADGVVSSANCSGLKNFAELTTPAAPFSERIHFIEGASTPPFSRRGIRLDSNSFTPPMTARISLIPGKSRGPRSASAQPQ